ncbi:hypothetical protein BH10ACT9_BH10ACT9_03700 [soil metagenome]
MGPLGGWAHPFLTSLTTESGTHTMQISARSYLTAGVSLTTAAAIALTPVAVPTADRAVSIPNVTVSEINLTVTPGEIVAFFDTLRTRIDEFNASVAEVAAVPGQTLVDGVVAAMGLNDSFFESLINAVDNPTLRALLETMEVINDRALRSLAFYVDHSNQTIVLAGKDIGDLLGGIMTVSLSNILSSAVDALNNPLSFEKYAHVLAATVGSGFLVVNGSSLIAQKAGNAGFDLAFGTLDFVRAEATTALDAVRRLSFVASGATGSELVQAAVAAVGTIGLAPAYLGLRLPVSLAEETVLSAQSAFNTVFNSIAGYRDVEGQYVPGVVTAMGEAVREAIDEIGHGPLDPQRYLTATALMIAGSFDAANLSINAAGALTQVPFTLGINLIAPDSLRPNLTSVVVAENIQMANALSNLLRTAGLPDDIADLPLAVAEQVNDAITGTAYTVADGLANVNAAITGGTDLIVTVSNDIENAILGALSGEETDPPASGGDEPADNEPIIVVPPVDDSTDDEDDTDDDTEEGATDPDDFIVDDGDDTDWDDDEFGDADESGDADEALADEAPAEEDADIADEEADDSASKDGSEESRSEGSDSGDSADTSSSSESETGSDTPAA